MAKKKVAKKLVKKTKLTKKSAKRTKPTTKTRTKKAKPTKHASKKKADVDQVAKKLAAALANVETDAERLERLLREDREKLRDMWDTCMPMPPSEDDLDDPGVYRFLIDQLKDDEIEEWLEDFSA